MSGASRPHILCVDDEQGVLDGLHLQLSRKYKVSTALSGPAGLEILRDHDDIKIIVSDMRMPKMNGAAFLAQAREVAPDTVRMLLTGHTDIESAIKAVNEGFIFRFLTKPCASPILHKAITDALEQRRLLAADKELLQQKLDEMSGQLLHAERLATLGTIAAGIGHELKNVATILIGTVPFIVEDSEAGEPAQKQDLDKLELVSKHLLTHGHQLMALAKPVNDEQEAEDLRPLVNRTLEMLKTIGKTKYLKVHTRFPGEAAYVNVNQTRMEQVLVNLLGNAADAVTMAERNSGTLTIEMTTSDEQVRCAIHDDGVGIPQDKIDEVFESYYTTKPPGKGTGLGLPVVKRIIESYDGTLTVESVVGKGSTFCFTLPRCEAPE